LGSLGPFHLGINLEGATANPGGQCTPCPLRLSPVLLGVGIVAKNIRRLGLIMHETFYQYKMF